MKSFLLVTVLAALAVCNNAASIPDDFIPYQEDIVLTEQDNEVFQKDYNLEGKSAVRNNGDPILLYEYVYFSSDVLGIQ